MSLEFENSDDDELPAESSEYFTIDDLIQACNENGNSVPECVTERRQIQNDKQVPTIQTPTSGNSFSSKLCAGFARRLDFQSEPTSGCPNGRQGFQASTNLTSDVTTPMEYDFVVECFINSVVGVQDSAVLKNNNPPVVMSAISAIDEESFRMEDVTFSPLKELIQNGFCSVDPGINWHDNLGSKEQCNGDAHQNVDKTPNSISSGVNSVSSDPPSASTSHGADAEREEVFRRATKRRRGRLSNVEVQKRLRMEGKEYIGASSTKCDNSAKRQLKQEVKPPRRIGVPCTSKKCAKSKLRNCARFSEEERNKIFFDFWKNQDWGKRISTVRALVDKKTPARKKNQTSSPKNHTLIYSLKRNEVKSQVCREMFLSTLGIKRGTLHCWLKNTDEQNKKKRGRKPKVPETEDAKTFLATLPKMPSHYCRKYTSKLYLEPDFANKNQVYKNYCHHIKSLGLKPLSRKPFSAIVEEMGIEIFKPRKDRCDICVSHEAGNLSEEEYDLHISLKNLAQSELRHDRVEASVGKLHLLTMDLQAVQVCPVLNASSLYFKTKLLVHNFTIFNNNNSHTMCYLWDETDGDLSASSFATCVLDYLNTNLKDNAPVVIFSDGCTAQNRNAVLANALLNYAVSKNKVITQKFLEKGHTYMEVDSVHSTIERALKGKKIFVPKDYIEVCMNAREQPSPYDVKYMTYDKFLDFSNVDRHHYPSIRPKQSNVVKIKQLQYNPSGHIYYQLTHSDNWTELPGRKAEISSTAAPPKLMHRRPISARKYKDLQDLSRVIPASYHDFYNSLPRE